MTADGAHALLRTLLAAGIDTCFTNPGTSEIRFVAALDSLPRMRAILTLFEGVATGAADGYARMTATPGTTLLHLGPGLANGLANLHNARRARVPLLNLVGDHATGHVAHDAPLHSDIATIARNPSAWVRTASSAERLAGDTSEAIAAALGPPGRVATLIVPADIAEGAAGAPADPGPPRAPLAPDAAGIEAVARALRAGRRTGILLGGRALLEPALTAAARVAAVSGARLLAEMFPARMQRGAGLPAVERLLYWPELACAQLAGLDELVLVDAAAPVSFFAYPGTPGSLVPDGCTVHELTDPRCDVTAALEQLVLALGAADAAPVLQQHSPPPLPADGPLTAAAVCQVVGALLPEGAIVSDEAITSGAALPACTSGAPRHDWLTLTGGAIGQGLPVAVGAAVACPQQPVIALQADGSALYTMQALWTMAREGLDVTVVLFNNRAYNILDTELRRAGVSRAGTRTAAQVALGDPAIDFAALATGFGVPARTVRDVRALVDALRAAIAEPGPHLIDAIVPAEAPPAAILGRA